MVLNNANQTNKSSCCSFALVIRLLIARAGLGALNISAGRPYHGHGDPCIYVNLTRFVSNKNDTVQCQRYWESRVSAQNNQQQVSHVVRTTKPCIIYVMLEESLFVLFCEEQEANSRYVSAHFVRIVRIQLWFKDWFQHVCIRTDNTSYMFRNNARICLLSITLCHSFRIIRELVATFWKLKLSDISNARCSK